MKPWCVDRLRSDIQQLHQINYQNRIRRAAEHFQRERFHFPSDQEKLIHVFIFSRPDHHHGLLITPALNLKFLIHTSRNGFGPECFYELLMENKPSSTLRSAESDQIVEPRVQTKNGESGLSTVFFICLDHLFFFFCFFSIDYVFKDCVLLFYMLVKTVINKKTNNVKPWICTLSGLL